MRLTKVLLRWYRSFNVNYGGYHDGSDGASELRPWNGTGDFPFVEIPIDAGITTIVGLNETGKSHLLTAIEKVLVPGQVKINDFVRRCGKKILEMPWFPV